MSLSSLRPKSRLRFSNDNINVLPGPFCVNGTLSKLAPNRLESREWRFRSMYVDPHLPPIG
jgi:hypothetical protein